MRIGRGRDPQSDIARRDQRQVVRCRRRSPSCTTACRRASRARSCCATAGRDRERRCAPGRRRSAAPLGKRAVGGDAQRQRIACDQAFDRAGGGSRLILGCGPAARRWPRGFRSRRPRSARFRSAASRPSGSAAAWRRSEAARSARRALIARTALSRGASTELAEEIEEIVGDRSRAACRHRPNAARGRGRRAAACVQSCRKPRAFERLGCPGSVRLASLLGTQPLVPPRAGTDARSYKSQLYRRNGFVGRSPESHYGPRCCIAQSSYAGRPAQRGNQMAGALFQQALHILGAVESRHSERSFQGCNNSEPPPKTAQIVISKESHHLCPLARNSPRTCRSFAATRAR